jgi:hypothetical protein
LSANDVRRTLDAAGYPALEVEPFLVPSPTIRATVKRLRKIRAGETFSALSALSINASVGELARRMISIADRETKRMAGKQANGQLEVMDFQRMAGSLLKLAELAPRLGERPPTAAQDGPSTFAAALQADSAADPPLPPLPPTEQGASRNGYGQRDHDVAERLETSGRDNANPPARFGPNPTPPEATSAAGVEDLGPPYPA